VLVADSPAVAAGSDYAELSRAIKRGGLLRRRPTYYSVTIAANLLLLAGGWTEGLHLHAAGVRALLGHRHTMVKVAEASLLAAHMGGSLAAVFLVLSPEQAVTFLACFSRANLGSTWEPRSLRTTRTCRFLRTDEKLDFLRRQVLTSRNIRGGGLTDLALGGLNYQIEHHLFPSMPRPNLRRARAPVRAFCASRGIPYGETGLLASYAQVLRHLHLVARPRPRPDPEETTGQLRLLTPGK
jgi:fatty acid desaturase